jgi:hypothetical protein
MQSQKRKVTVNHTCIPAWAISDVCASAIEEWLTFNGNASCSG